ncbi:hypothetical protein L2E82_12690 [Cichorium intybus]|uniref:Uncharacterized protein n=1 Tax=Cichorium intybus TaxID=13427 RepID=A0ACB9GIQ6_CICIN|nr:hypothetical protein L2E82_12690 [Cichorium intybus]
MLWTGEGPDPKALEETMASYSNLLQGFLLLSHGSIIGAGTTLSSCIHASVKQVIDCSFMLLKESVASYDVLREMKEFKPTSNEEISKPDDDNNNKDNIQENSSPRAIGPRLMAHGLGWVDIGLHKAITLVLLAGNATLIPPQTKRFHKLKERMKKRMKTREIIETKAMEVQVVIQLSCNSPLRASILRNPGNELYRKSFEVATKVYDLRKSLNIINSAVEQVLHDKLLEVLDFSKDLTSLEPAAKALACREEQENAMLQVLMRVEQEQKNPQEKKKVGRRVESQDIKRRREWQFLGILVSKFANKEKPQLGLFSIGVNVFYDLHLSVVISVAFVDKDREKSKSMSLLECLC